MARSQREAIAIVLDIGRSVSQQVMENGKSYLDNARSCISMILQRKLFCKKNDLVGLFLLSSNNTINSLDYEHIELQFPMSPVSWDMLKFIEQEVKPTSINGDWLDAMVVGMQYIKDELEATSFLISAKKLLVFSNFVTPVPDNEVELITNGLKSLDIELIVIGPSVVPVIKKEEVDEEGLSISSQSNGKVKTEAQELGEALISRIVTEVGGVICSFDDAVPQLQFFETKKIKPSPWNVVMDIGPGIKIRVAGYKKIADVTLPSWKVTSIQSGKSAETSGVEMERTYFKQNSDQTPVVKSDIISGYMFGSTIVPFSDVDKMMLQYQSGNKCLSVLGFTDATNVPKHLLVGEGVHYFFAQAGDASAAVALSALVRALNDSNMVAIVRRVYRDNCAPVIGVLLPKVRPNYECLVYIELPYSEDIRQYTFPTLNKSTKPTEKQLDCIDNLIDSMNLMEAEDEGEMSEAFHPKRNLNPYHQHFYQTLCDRGLNPDGPLPPVKQNILDLLVSPFAKDPRVAIALSDIKENFTLVPIKQTEPRLTAADLFKQENHDAPQDATGVTVLPVAATTMAEITSNTVVQIGTVNPVSDFHTMLEGGQLFACVAKEMEDVIVNLVLRSFGSDDFGKAVLALRALREKCIFERSACIYNDFLTDFKEKLLSRGKKTFWERVVQDNVGLITSTESPSSNMDLEMATKFLIIPETDGAKQDQDNYMDVEDLFDEM